VSSYADRFERELRVLISERMDQLKSNLAIGRGVETLEDYRKIVGHIAGLQEAVDMFEDAKSIIEKD
jgi:hypothetical protein